jgi:hypothetical protein
VSAAREQSSGGNQAKYFPCVFHLIKSLSIRTEGL